TATSGASSGRILLLQGEAGSGKTHLMRAFRNWAHEGGRGFYGYMQMTSATNQYSRYVLNNLIDSLDQPYDERAGETSGLMRLSEHDRRTLGGTTARHYDDAPQWLIQRLGELMISLGSVPLILCVDQLEDIFNLDDNQLRFRRAVAALCDIVSRTPSAVVVIS